MVKDMNQGYLETLSFDEDPKILEKIQRDNYHLAAQLQHPRIGTNRIERYTVIGTPGVLGKSELTEQEIKEFLEARINKEEALVTASARGSQCVFHLYLK